MKKLYGGAIATGSGATIYTVPTGYKCEVQDISIANGDGSTAGISLHFVPVGGTADTSNVFLNHYHIDLHGQYVWHGVQVLNEGDSIHATSDKTDCAIHIAGDEIR